MELDEAKQILKNNGYKIDKFPGQEYITAIKKIFPNAMFKKVEDGWVCNPEDPDSTIKWEESTVGFKYEDDTLMVWIPDWEHLDDDDYFGGEWTNLYSPKGIKDYVDAVHEEAEKYKSDLEMELNEAKENIVEQEIVNQRNFLETREMNWEDWCNEVEEELRKYKLSFSEIRDNYKYIFLTRDLEKFFRNGRDPKYTAKTLNYWFGHNK